MINFTPSQLWRFHSLGETPVPTPEQVDDKAKVEAIKPPAKPKSEDK